MTDLGPEYPSDDLRGAATAAVRWSSAAHIAGQALSFLIGVVLARLLAPEDFGLMGMADIFIGLAMAAAMLGLGTALVQKRGLQRAELNAAFWTMMTSSVAFSILLAAISPLIAWFFNRPELQPVMALGATMIVCLALGQAHMAFLVRRIDFAAVGLGSFAGVIAGGMTAIPLAALGFGPYALLLGGIARHLGASFTYWFKARTFKPGRPRFAEVRGLMRFGLKTAGGTLMTELQGNADYLVVGKMLGKDPLGIYTKAFDLATMPHTKIFPAMAKVLTPTFSAVQDDNDRLRRGYLEVSRMFSIAVFPMLAGLAAVAPEFVLCVYGEKWTRAAVPLQFLCFAAMMLSLIATAWPVYYAKGRPGLALVMKAASAFLIAAATCAAVKLGGGLNAVAAAVLVYTAVFTPTVLHFCGKLIDLRLASIAAAVWPAFVLSVGMLAATTGLSHVLSNYLPVHSWLKLWSLVLFGAALYPAALAIFFPRLMSQVYSVGLELIGRPRRDR